MHTSSNTIFIKTGYESIRVELDEVLYAESDGNCINFILADKKITSKLTMSETEALLPSKDFIRIHRSYIVLQKRISKIDRNNVWINKTELPAGASFVEASSKIL